MLMRAETVVQQLCKCCRTSFIYLFNIKIVHWVHTKHNKKRKKMQKMFFKMFYCMFYFTCDRSLTLSATVTARESSLNKNNVTVLIF